MAVQVTVYPGRVRLEEFSPYAHREAVLVADPRDTKGDALAEQVADWCNGADAVYVDQQGDSGTLHKSLSAALKRADVEVQTKGRATDTVAGDLPYRGAKVVRPADEAAVVMGEPPEGFRQPGQTPEEARPLEPKDLPSREDSVGTTHAHHVGGKRARTD